MSAIASTRYDYSDGVTKLLLPQRDAYIAQSARAVNNRVVYPTFPKTQPAQPVSSGRGLSQPDPPAWDEVVTCYADRRGY